jgi:hypothetical protein
MRGIAIVVAVVLLCAPIAFAELTPEETDAFVKDPFGFLSYPASDAKIADSITAIRSMNDNQLADLAKSLFASGTTLPPSLRTQLNTLLVDPAFDLTSPGHRDFTYQYLSQGVQQDVGRRFINELTRGGTNDQIGLEYVIAASAGNSMPKMEKDADGNYVVTTATGTKFVLKPYATGQKLVYSVADGKERLELTRFNPEKTTEPQTFRLPEGATVRPDSTDPERLYVNFPLDISRNQVGTEALVSIGTVKDISIDPRTGDLILHTQKGDTIDLPKGGSVRVDGDTIGIRTNILALEKYAFTITKAGLQGPLIVTMPWSLKSYVGVTSTDEGMSLLGTISEVAGKTASISFAARPKTENAEFGVWIGNNPSSFPSRVAARNGIAVNTGDVTAQNPAVVFVGNVKADGVMAATATAPARNFNFNSQTQYAMNGLYRDSSGKPEVGLLGIDTASMRQAVQGQATLATDTKAATTLGMSLEDYQKMTADQRDKALTQLAKQAKQEYKGFQERVDKATSDEERVSALENRALAEERMKNVNALRTEVSAAVTRNPAIVATLFDLTFSDPDPKKQHVDTIHMVYDDSSRYEPTSAKGGIAGGFLKPIVTSRSIGPLGDSDGFGFYWGEFSTGKPIPGEPGSEGGVAGVPSNKIVFDGTKLNYQQYDLASGKPVSGTGESVGMFRLVGTPNEKANSVTYAIDRAQMLGAFAQGLMPVGSRVAGNQLIGMFVSGMADLFTVQTTDTGLAVTVNTNLGLPSMAQDKIGDALFSGQKTGPALKEILSSFGVTDPTMKGLVERALNDASGQLGAYRDLHGIPSKITVGVDAMPAPPVTPDKDYAIGQAIVDVVKKVPTLIPGFPSGAQLSQYLLESNDPAVIALKNWVTREASPVGVTLYADGNPISSTTNPLADQVWQAFVAKATTPEPGSFVAPLVQWRLGIGKAAQWLEQDPTDPDLLKQIGEDKPLKNKQQAEQLLHPAKSLQDQIQNGFDNTLAGVSVAMGLPAYAPGAAARAGATQPPSTPTTPQIPAPQQPQPTPTPPSAQPTPAPTPAPTQPIPVPTPQPPAPTTPSPTQPTPVPTPQPTTQPQPTLAMTPDLAASYVTQYSGGVVYAKDFTNIKGKTNADGSGKWTADIRDVASGTRIVYTYVFGPGGQLKSIVTREETL